jgi:hypothetical protein
MAGFYSLDDVTYNRANSSLTGINLSAEAHFDRVNSMGLVKGSSVSASWVQTNAYDADVIVENGYRLYKSNAAIPANTAFATGTSGATWSSLYPDSSAGELILPDGIYRVNSTNSPFSLFTFNLPAGKWKISTAIRVVNSTPNTDFVARLRVNNVTVPGSASLVMYSPTGNDQSTANGVSVITLTQTSEVKVAVWSNGGNMTALSDGNGYTKVFYEKIGP